METKKCSKCGIVKERGEFYKDKSKSDGLCSYCKKCSREEVKKWSNANPEKIKVKNKKMYEANQEKVKARRKKWVKDNPEKIKARAWTERQEIKDNYVKVQITKSGIPRKYITPELIELKRLHIQLQRKIKSKTKQL